MYISFFYVILPFVQIFAINVKSQFLVTQQAYIHMEEKGRIILMSSITAQKVSIAIPMKYQQYAQSFSSVGF
jgi:NAD(P)-dependent dehydrogenase (short-subunit alcohol dehydrogenase family)